MANIFQEQIQAEKPKAVASERIYVYVPRATVDTPGIASYDDTYFRLNAGKVYLRDTNPSEIPSLVKIDDKQDGLTYEQDSNGKYILKGWLKTVNNESLFGEDADEPGNIQLVTPSQLTSAISEHNSAEDAHPYIQNLITTRISNHNYAEDAHPYIRNLITTLNNEKQNKLNQAQLDAINSGITAGKIMQEVPTTSSNPLVNKEFVNSSINNIAAFYITYNAQGDAFPTKSALISASVFYSGGVQRTPTRNDYCIVRVDESQNNATTRYSYQNGQWEFQYVVNETAYTAAQLAAINSGITSQKVTEIDNKVDKDQMATKTTAGLVWAWEDGDGFHIWNIDPNEVHYTVEENAQGGLSVIIKTMNYEVEENEQGGLSVIIGGENE